MQIEAGLGAVFCQPLNLRFPTVYRIVQSMTREQLDKHGLHDEEPFKDCNYYTLTGPDNDAARFPGTIDRTRLRNLDPAIDCVSLVIHLHRSRAEASAYLMALFDYGVEHGSEPICRTEQGIFTLISRPTKSSWPGPLIIYCADTVPADNIIGKDSWEVAVAPDGTLIERFGDFTDF
jgi:hypothetical protein